MGRGDGVRDSRGEKEALTVGELQGEAERDENEVRVASEEEVVEGEAEPEGLKDAQELAESDCWGEGLA